jgi:transcriptional regulator with XRE-family HTH domain
MVEIATVRFANTQRLLDEFVRSRSGVDEVRGIETQFAARLGITKNYWSALKTGKRQIGATLARQFEARFGKPAHWLDQAQPPASARVTPTNEDEWLVTGLVLMAYRSAPEATRQGVAKLVELALGVRSVVETQQLAAKPQHDS